MDSMVYAYIAIIAALIACSAFFSMSETAFTSINQVRLKKKAREGDLKAERCLKILEDYDKLLTTILIGNNLVNILASSLSTIAIALIFVGLASSTVSLISTIVMTVLVLIFGEITPKTIAKKNPERCAIMLCTAIHYIIIILSPFSWVFTKITNAISSRMGKESPAMTEDELEVMIDEIEDDGVIEESEGRLIKSAIRFDDTEIGEIYTPRVDVVGIDVESSVEELAKTFNRSGYSRIPVYSDSIDNIIGVAYAKEFYSMLYEKKTFSVKDLTKEVKYFPETANLNTVLNDFQKSKVHMAVVLDSYGGTMGIVTLEDVLEELVGDIWDESDVIQQDVVQSGEDRYVVKGNANIFDVMEKLNVEFDPGEYEDYSVTGYVFHRLGRTPSKGDVVEAGRVKMTVRSVKGRRAIECIFEVAPQSEEPEEES